MNTSQSRHPRQPRLTVVVSIEVRHDSLTRAVLEEKTDVIGATPDLLPSDDDVGNLRPLVTMIAVQVGRHLMVFNQALP